MTRARAIRGKPNPAAMSVVGSERDLAVLETLAWAGILRTGQIETLFFKTRRRAQRRMRALLDHGLVRSHRQGEALHREDVFTLAPKGMALLETKGAFPDGPPKPARLPRISKLAHALAIRDVFVAFLAAEHTGSSRLVDFRFEEDLAREPAFRAARLVPDAVGVVEADGRSSSFAVEVDLGTETSTTLRGKLEAWARFHVGGAGQRFAALLVVADADSRARLLWRLASEAQLGTWATVVPVAGLPALVGCRWPHTCAVPPRRAERRGNGLDEADFKPAGDGRTAAFRPLS